MLWLLLFIATLGLFYLISIISLIYGWDRLRVSNFQIRDFQHVTIIVAARNEDQHISDCIRSLLHQSYPSTYIQIIIVDDYSTDQTANNIKAFDGITYLQLSDWHLSGEIRSGKKKCIEYALTRATGTYIMITDADCVAPHNWVQSTVGAFQSEEADVVAGPVCINNTATFFNQLQALDFWSYISLSASCIGLNRPVMSNGANFSFRKQLFSDVKGYDGYEHITSGDDVLLLHKFINQGAKVYFNKTRDALVGTKAEDSLLSFFTQRLRWASKTAAYRNVFLIVIIVMIYLYYVALPFCLIAAISHPVYIKWFAGIALMKSFIDFIYLYRVLNFFNQRNLLRLFLPAQLFHVCYVLLVGAVALFVPLRWKGRKIYR